ncbi:MAG: DUF3576 domain-containing protein [Alphaproteobacteria bacterium]|nr:DUF3576 domain-containing protein [Alphaproteobacteria bacterium]
MKNNTVGFFLLLIYVGILGGCSSVPDIGGEAKYPSGADRTTTGGDIYGERESIFGEGGWQIFGGKDSEKEDGSSGIGVNSYLWRASLDTVSFMPLASADPFGGVIITDWYSAPEKPDERFKVNIFIQDRQLRSSGVKVKVFRQISRKGGAWKDADVAKSTEDQMVDAILTRARQIRVAELNDE